MTGIAARPPGAIGSGRIRWPQPLARIAAVALRNRASLLWISAVVMVGGLVHGVNMGGAPVQADDEGTYTAQAWSIFHLGQLTHYAYWYDHPPLGWIQIALYTELTGAWARYGSAVLAARESMLVAALVSAVLLWVLARRVGLSRMASAAAAVLFLLSPLAVQEQRMVYLDNIAVPWLLAAFLLALTRGSQLSAFAGSSLCFAIAVLSKETSLLALPFLVWIIVARVRPQVRHYTLTIAACTLFAAGSSYLIFAAVKGELFPSAGVSSLFDGISFQLGGRQSSGSVFDPTSLAARTLSGWSRFDAGGMVAATAGAVLGLFSRRLRPFAALLIFHLLMIVRPGGYLPIPYVIVLLPFGALVVVGVLEFASRRAAAWFPRRSRRAILASLTAIAVAAGVGVLTPAWGPQLQNLLTQNQQIYMATAQSWAASHIDRSSRLMVDDAMWVDLVNAGWAPADVVWYYKVDTDPAIQALAPRGWRDYGYVIATESMRQSLGQLPQVAAAVAHSTVVASFGQGVEMVEVRRIDAAIVNAPAVQAP